MREIKFRAWDNGEYNISAPRMLYWGLFRNDDTYLLDTEETVPDENLVMQYTGLKDKNGVEIYEGDIVRLAEPEYNKGHIIGVRCKNLIEGNPAFAENEFENCEVIGNIYENPDLLEAKDA